MLADAKITTPATVIRPVDFVKMTKQQQRRYLVEGGFCACCCCAVKSLKMSVGKYLFYPRSHIAQITATYLLDVHCTACAATDMSRQNRVKDLRPYLAR
jgi:hypothetical protein